MLDLILFVLAGSMGGGEGEATQEAQTGATLAVAKADDIGLGSACLTSAHVGQI